MKWTATMDPYLRVADIHCGDVHLVWNSPRDIIERDPNGGRESIEMSKAPRLAAFLAEMNLKEVVFKSLTRCMGDIQAAGNDLGIEVEKKEENK